ncbi:MAG: Protease synthase and sporulation protein 2 [Bacteroidota bacterium]|jgi:transcriptional regulator
MYIPENYTLTNQAEIHEFIQKNSFALLINQTQGRLWATHLPLVLDIKSDGTPYLLGHLSKLNPQSTSLHTEDEVLVVFTGPNAYISSSWYDHENVPTWNYIAVHVYGKVRLHSHEEALEGLKKLVDKFEENVKNPIRIENLSEKTMREARGITGFEIEITSIQAQKKLSQNRDNHNYQSIITQLENQDDAQAKAVAAAMKKNRP